MQPTRFRSLHCFDARSLALFASLTMGGTHAIMAQNIYPASPTPRSMHAPAPAAAPTAPVLRARRGAATSSCATTPTHEQTFERASLHVDANGNGTLSHEEFILALTQH